MPYIPHTPEDVEQMLQIIGVHSIEELFVDIPTELRLRPESLNIPNALDEFRIIKKLGEIAKHNKSAADLTCYLGAGIYDRYIPSSVGAIISRGEFLTAYTPYQPEASQGYLQTIYEFQSMIAELYGMALANASMYDGATSMAEAAIMAHGVNGRSKIAVSEAIHPHYRQVLETYAWGVDLEVVTAPLAEGRTSDLSVIDDSVACLIVGYPNFFGQIEDLDSISKVCKKAGALMIVVADPVACSLLVPPGHFGADVVVGEGQPLGVPMGFGGPMVGLFSCKEEYVRRIPGRIVGKTTEIHGDQVGFTMTLRTREQDIRREKATSNICTNEALMALCNTVYMAALGKNGLKQVAEASVRNSRYAAQKLTEAGAKIVYKGKYFCEFVIELPRNASEVSDALIPHGILAGLPLGEFYKGMENRLLIAVTEKRTKEEIDHYATSLKKVINH